MSFETLGVEPERFRLQGARGEIALHATGMQHPMPSLLRRRTVFTPYADITHLSNARRAIRLGTRRSVYTLPRALFADPAGPDRLVRALLERVVREPGGEAQLARMAEVEQLARTPAPLRACAIVALACLAVYAVQLFRGPAVHYAALFSTTLVGFGEIWRLVTANLLHAGFTHLALNVLGLLAVGSLVERPLGAASSFFVLGAAAFGAMGAGILANYEMALGASGLVSGLAGAALWLELRHPERLPAGWRIPRRILVGALLGDALLSALVPAIAGAAHLGGFLAGYVAAAWVGPAALRREWPRPGLVLANALLGLVALASVGAAAVEVLRGADLLAARAERLLEDPQAPPTLLNDTAWLLVTAEARTAEQVDVALRLAERAVDETERQDPNVLDTLAEAQFAAGLDGDAVATIDEAIALAPREPYFQEQRRRFTGERAPENRPRPPSGPLPEDAPELRSPRLPPGHPPIREESPGIAI